MRRLVLHVDMDTFFASVEVKERPYPSNKPVVVGADPTERRGRGGGRRRGRGVVTSCNYHARTKGLHSGMPISE